MQIGILEPANFSSRAINYLSKIGKVSQFENQKLNIFLQDKDALFIRLRYHIDTEFLNKAPNLKYICTPTTGLNHLDLDAISNRNIEIVSLKKATEFLTNVRATPEHCFGLTLALLRNYKDAFLSQENVDWDRDKLRGFEVFENTVGIIGFGRVGKLLARYFDAFGAKVLFYDNNPDVEHCFNAQRLGEVHQLIRESNIVLLCASYEEANDGFIDKFCIDLLADKYFINCARGELVDEEYLIKKISENYFKGIALDVIVGETKSQNNWNRFQALTKSRNFILTPHIGGATHESMWKTEEYVAKELLSLVIGRLTKVD
ncbi:MAG: NAD(P)-dependent oxidoreductase [Thermincola sp.]|jgi:phosphoglycerate dehydrogenase-like enzyme|nr:NAD(P)-dependent oxidoreductase [Thermincola sp.]